MKNTDKYLSTGQAYAEETNQLLAMLFNKILDSEDIAGSSEREFAENLSRRFMSETAKWYAKPSAGLDGKNLEKYIQTLDENELLALTVGIASKLDFDLPEVLVNALKEVSEETKEATLEELLKLSAEAKNQRTETSDEQDEIYLTSQLLVILSLWPNEDRVSKVLEWYLAVEVPDDRIGDAVSIFLESAGQEAIPAIENIVKPALKGDDKNNPKYAYLLQGLTNIAKHEEAMKDDVYKVLREAFKTLNSKSMIALMLGDLGSARAIPLLRSYVENNQTTIDEGLYYDIVASLKKLDANLEGLPDLKGRFAAERRSQ